MVVVEPPVQARLLVMEGRKIEKRQGNDGGGEREKRGRLEETCNNK